MKGKVYIGILLIMVVWMLSPTIADAQCAMCNATASTATEGNKESAMALNSGILFLMAIPYLILMTLLIVWLRYRKQKKREQVSNSQL
jgi:hypothetical protein